MCLAMMVASLGLAASQPFAQPAMAAECGNIKTSIIPLDCKKIDKKSSDPEKSAAWQILLLALNIMTAGIGILAVGGIVYASILYAGASDKAEQTKKAISIILNIVLGLAAYAGMYLFLNFLIPGGIFN